MAGTDPITGARYPGSADAPNVNQDLQNLANDLSPLTHPYFTSTASRDTHYSSWVSAGGTMRDGLHCHVQGVGDQTYLSGSWRTGYSSDTGWVTLNLNSPLSQGTFGSRYRVRNGVCEVMLDAAYSGTYGVGFTLNNNALPLPSNQFYLAGTYYGTVSAAMLYLTTGGFIVNNVNATAGGVTCHFSYFVG